MKVAVTVMLAAGIVAVVAADATSAREPMSPVHAANTFPAGMTAATATVVAAAYEPPPVPLTTVSV